MKARLDKYRIVFDGAAERVPAYIFAADEESAGRILHANFGPSPKVRLEYVGPATKAEREAFGREGGRSLRKRDG